MALTQDKYYNQRSPGDIVVKNDERYPDDNNCEDFWVLIPGLEYSRRSLPQSLGVYP
ncbi:MAG: hypothetical protein HC930_08595 [Hydrococcus sp. SU_1_0]|nr:hypothetical protein [Hydrococcus sp. SU_1_0]